MVTKLLFNEETQRIWKEIYQKNSIKAPFFTYKWHKIWLETLGKDYQPLILLVNGKIIASFAQKESQVIFSGGEEVADYLDIVGPDEHKANAWTEILDFLRSQGITSLQLKNIPQSSPTFSFFKNQAIVNQEDTTPIIYLPDTWDEYLVSLGRKHRHELKRKIRKFEREHSQIKVVPCTKPVVECDELFRLMRLNPRKNKFLSPAMELFLKKIIEEFDKDVRLLHLKINGKTVSSLLSFMTPKSEYLYNSGFDEQGYSGSGFYLKAKDIQAAIEKGIKEYNFLQGSERYKYELGAKYFFIYSVSMDLS